MSAITVFNLLSNMMRAVGDSRTPLYFLVLACVINIALDYIFILGLGSGVIGAGVATVIAQLFAGVACVPVIKRRFPQLAPARGSLRVARAELALHLRMALPVGFQWSIIAIGAVAVTFAVNGMDVTAVAAFTTGQKIEQLAVMPLSSYGQAMTTYAAQNFGARKFSRIRTGVVQGSLIAAVFSVLMFAVFFFWDGSIAAVFLTSEEAALALAHEYLKIGGAFFVLLSLLFDFRSTI
jgi:Na+-driven multidrug efflux pump